jgi:hypothetical protein
VQPAALVQGDADEQPDPEYLVPALLEAARQPKVMAAMRGLFDGTGVCVCVVGVGVMVTSRGAQWKQSKVSMKSGWTAEHPRGHGRLQRC